MTKRRKNIAKRFDLIRLFASILIGIFFAVIVIFLISEEPLNAVNRLLLGPLKNIRRFGNVIELMIPLTLSGLSIAVMFSADQFNLGTEGAFYAGGAIAAITALSFGLPAGLSPMVSILLAGLTGGLICLISGILKVKFDTSELVSSLMLNYIVYYIFKYIMFSGPYKDAKAGFVATYKISKEANLSGIVAGTKIHSGLIIMIILVILVHVYLNKTRWDFSLKITGQNKTFAKYAGIGVTGVILSSQFLGGVLGGIGGAVQMLGLYERFQWVTLPGFGFDGVIVSILARKKPLYIPIAAFFLAYLRIGSDAMSSSTDVTNELISIIQSVIILFVSAEFFLNSYKQKLIVKEAIRDE